MDAQAIYRKSDKGAEAIASRALAGKLRTLLILVDGKKTIANLRELAAGLGEPEQLLAQLKTEGFIEPVSGAVPVPPAAPTTAAMSTVPVADAGKSLVKVKALATHLLAEVIGPMADDVSLKIEAAQDVPHFIAAMKLAYTVVREVRGQGAADRFGQEIENQMPQI